MTAICGRLLIGGMALEHLKGDLREGSRSTASWSGYLLIDPPHRKHLETDRPYRLELDDGRAGQLVLSTLEPLPDEPRLQATFEGISTLEVSSYQGRSASGILAQSPAESESPSEAGASPT